MRKPSRSCWRTSSVWSNLWQTAILRKSKLHVIDEINNAVSYYPITFLKRIPSLTCAYQKWRANSAWLSRRWELLPMTMGMWIGGDRDGNPFVTAQTLRAMCPCAGESRVCALFGRAAVFGAGIAVVFGNHHDERSAARFGAAVGRRLRSIARMSRIVRQSLVCTGAWRNCADAVRHDRDAGAARIKSLPPYASAEEFAQDLQVLPDSLRANNSAALIEGRLNELIGGRAYFQLSLGDH